MIHASLQLGEIDIVSVVDILTCNLRRVLTLVILPCFSVGRRARSQESIKELFYDYHFE